MRCRFESSLARAARAATDHHWHAHRSPQWATVRIQSYEDNVASKRFGEAVEGEAEVVVEAATGVRSGFTRARSGFSRAPQFM